MILVDCQDMYQSRVMILETCVAITVHTRDASTLLCETY